MTSLPVSSLRAHLLCSLTSLPGSRAFHLHVLASSPRRPTQSLFPYASSRPKCLYQDVLVLLSEQASPAGAEHDSSSVAKEDPITTSPQPYAFVTAIEACVYSFPTSHSTILYISKVDGTGQGIFPSPTSTLLHALVLFYASPRSPVYMTPTTHHLWIHLFARSQRQYLFPNSADHPNKKPLGDVALCKWWKKNLSDIAKAVEDTNNNVKTDGVSAAAQSSRLYYLLPGQSEQEASYLLRESQPSHVRWIYSHPYDIPAETLPYPSDPDNKFPFKRYGPRPLASLIPHFEDDPKTRFLDELAATSEDHSVAVPIPTPKKKRQKIGEGDESSNSTLTDNHHAMDAIARRTEEAGEPYELLLPAPEIIYIPPSSSPPTGGHSPPSRPSTPKPIESNCSPLLSPHTPDLPTLPITHLSPQTPTPGTATTLQRQIGMASPRTPQTPRTPRRPVSDLDTISISEFWERMSYRQECAQGAVTGFFVAIFSRQCDPPTSDGDSSEVVSQPPSNSKTTLDPSAPAEINPLLLLEGTVPHSVIKRIMSSLLTGVEFSTAERSHKGTQVIETAIKGLCEGLGHINSRPPAKEPRINDVKILAKESGTTKSDIYQAHVYSSISVSNPPLVRKSANSPGAAGFSTNPPVNVLGVRRKKKKRE